MKQIIERCMIIMLCVLTTGCVTHEEQVKKAQALATELETSKDIIKAIETYNQSYRHICFSTDIQTDSSHRKQIYYGVYVGDNFYDCDRIVLQELTQEQIDLGCLYKNWATDTYYNSDECVLQRRAHPATSVGFFDYKRFLPQNNKIKTDVDWQSLVAFYNNEKYCKSNDEKTSYEKQECREQQNQTTIKLATTKVQCKTAYGHLYYDNVKELRELCGYPCNWNILESYMKEWSTEHLCSIDGWNEDAYLRDMVLSNWGYYRAPM